jgi:ribonuclease VapC
VILDSSAVVAILREEPEAGDFSACVEAAATVAMSTATVLETSIVMGPHSQGVLDRFLAWVSVDQRPVDHVQLTAAREAHRLYGRGSGHPARLNFGDCFSYALAKTSGEPLLFKGADFAQTDVTPAYVPDRTR